MSKIRLRKLEDNFLFSPLALLLIDGLTGRTPLGRVDLLLERKTGAGEWSPVERKPQVSGTGVWSFPGLGRTVAFTDSPADFRVSIDAEYYFPSPQNGFPFPFSFRVFAYNDHRPLGSAQYARFPWRIDLLPNERYPFPADYPIIYGRVVDSSNRPIEKAEIKYKLNVSVLTDANGFFAAPILSPPVGAWPANEVWLTQDSRSREYELTLSSIRGVSSGDWLELEEDHDIVLDEDAQIGQAEIVVSDVSKIQKSMKLFIQDRALSPRSRSVGISEIDVASRRVKLTTLLSQELHSGTRLLLRSRRYRVQSVDERLSTVTLFHPLKEPWTKVARVRRFMPVFEIDVTHQGEVSQAPVPLPDGFRLLEIELT